MINNDIHKYYIEILIKFIVRIRWFGLEIG